MWECQGCEGWVRISVRAQQTGLPCSSQAASLGTLSSCTGIGLRLLLFICSLLHSFLLPNLFRPGLKMPESSQMAGAKPHSHSLSSSLSEFACFPTFCILQSGIFNLLIHQLPPKPPQPPASKKRKRVSDDVPECKSLKPLLSGSIPVDQFVQTLEKVRNLQWQGGIPADFCTS